MSGRTLVRLGISTCPNDTFALAGILTGAVDTSPLRLEVSLQDIQQLNDALSRGEFDVAKTSFAAAMGLRQYRILPVGSALGFGVGPLLLASKPEQTPEMGTRQLTLCPGRDTTATLLMETFYPGRSRIEHVVFSQIMPRLLNDTAEFGVCIHEGRFTWQSSGLALVEDLGARWEREMSCPLPLGGLVVGDHLDANVTDQVVDAIDRSLAWARRHIDESLPVMRHWAQDQDDAVLMQHVDLYVNDWTTNLGDVGRNAITRLFATRDRRPRFVDRA